MRKHNELVASKADQEAPRKICGAMTPTGQPCKSLRPRPGAGVVPRRDGPPTAEAAGGAAKRWPPRSFERGEREPRSGTLSLFARSRLRASSSRKWRRALGKNSQEAQRSDRRELVRIYPNWTIEDHQRLRASTWGAEYAAHVEDGLRMRRSCRRRRVRRVRKVCELAGVVGGEQHLDHDRCPAFRE